MTTQAREKKAIHGARRKRRAPSRVRVALVSTGSEILQGLYPDTNAQWLATRLDGLGFDVVAIRAIGDDIAETERGLEPLSRDADLIISTGGLGPTEDDLFREACARLWRRPLVLSSQLLKQIEAFHRSRGRRSMADSNRRQALIPRGAQPLSNRWGTAPGFVIPSGGGRGALIALPGPPVEMHPMFERRALPWLRENLWPGLARRRSVIHTMGWPEARINEVLQSLFGSDSRVDLTILARSGKIDVRLTASADSDEEARSALSAMRRRVRRRIPSEVIYGRDDETLEEIVNRLLVKRGWTIAVAESCTGGLIAERLTSVPGASRSLNQCVVTYSNEAKRKTLGVRQTTLDRCGAVSEECVREMAEGVRRWSKADLGVSVSGIAGPSGGTKERPVGLVWIAVATAGHTVAKRYQIVRREREAIRLWAADRALNLARRMIEGTAETT